MQNEKYMDHYNELNNKDSSSAVQTNNMIKEDIDKKEAIEKKKKEATTKIINESLSDA